jgi:hypothetical protein
MLKIPRVHAGQQVSAAAWNHLCTYIEQALNLTVKGGITIQGPHGTTIIIPPGAGGKPILLAQTIGRHDAGIAQAVNLYSIDTSGTATQQTVGGNPVPVQAYNRITNLAGGIFVYITDMQGSGVIYEIIGADPCLQGSTAGPN